MKEHASLSVHCSTQMNRLEYYSTSLIKHATNLPEVVKLMPKCNMMMVMFIIAISLQTFDTENTLISMCTNFTLYHHRIHYNPDDSLKVTPYNPSIETIMDSSVMVLYKEA